MTGENVTGPGPALRNSPGVASAVVTTGLSRSSNIDSPYRSASTTSQSGSPGPGATLGCFPVWPWAVIAKHAAETTGSTRVRRLRDDGMANPGVVGVEAREAVLPRVPRRQALRIPAPERVLSRGTDGNHEGMAGGDGLRSADDFGPP